MFKFIQKFYKRANAEVRRNDGSVDHLFGGHDVNALIPVILPPEFLQLDWPGPIEALGDLPFSVGWATIDDKDWLKYAPKDAVAAWERNGIDWRQRAMSNLTQVAIKEPMSHERVDNHGKPVFLAMINEDAIGPSRLLVPNLFANILGDDYMVAIPERSCAIAYPADLPEAEAAEVDTVISNCFMDGTRPMTPERFDARRFWVL